MDIKDIKDLIITIDKTSIEKVEIEQKDIKIIISKKAGVEKTSLIEVNKNNSKDENTTTQTIDNDNIQYIDEVKDTEENQQLMDCENTFVVKSPIVGTFYEASGPDSSPFVNVGDRVEKGQTLCIIEAMKIMNEIQCEEAGQVIEICAKDEDIVEYGQPLVRIRR